jgi:GAF domain-containing protein
MMSPRLSRILSAWAAPGPADTRRLCTVSAQVLRVAGAGVMIDGGQDRAPLCASNEMAARVEDLCLTLGEGPGVDAHDDGVPVVEPDLARPLRARWPSFTPPAVAAGVAATFSFPLRLGGIRLGTLTLYEVHTGRLSADQYADALVMASVVLNAVLARQAEAPLGDLALELETLSSTRTEIHQATGMVSAQLEVSAADALVRLRAHAYAEGRTLSDVAADVLGKRLRLPP